MISDVTRPVIRGYAAAALCRLLYRGSFIHQRRIIAAAFRQDIITEGIRSGLVENAVFFKGFESIRA